MGGDGDTFISSDGMIFAIRTCIGWIDRKSIHSAYLIVHHAYIHLIYPRPGGMLEMWRDTRSYWAALCAIRQGIIQLHAIGQDIVH